MREPASSPIGELLHSFESDDPLRGRIAAVLMALPTEVIADFSSDDRFAITKLHHRPRGKQKLLMAFPAANGQASRCVVLKERLADCDLDFGHYVIAHELAHAYLRNGGWNGITDIEEAADALANHWGFPKPGRR